MRLRFLLAVFILGWGTATVFQGTQNGNITLAVLFFVYAGFLLWSALVSLSKEYLRQLEEKENK